MSRNDVAGCGREPLQWGDNRGHALTWRGRVALILALGLAALVLHALAAALSHS